METNTKVNSKILNLKMYKRYNIGWSEKSKNMINLINDIYIYTTDSGAINIYVYTIAV